MGLWKKIKKAVKDVGDFIEDIFNDVGDAIGNAAESIGAGIENGLNWIGSKIGLKGPFAWLGGVLKAPFSILGAGIKSAFGILGGLIGGSIKIIGGLLTGQLDVVLEGLWSSIAPLIGSVIVIVGKVISSVQTVFYIQDFERPLTPEEKALLRDVFWKTLNLYNIRIVEGHAGIFGLNNRAFTLANTIYMKTSNFPDSLLVHEVTHSWQYQQTGNRYAIDALGAQWFVEDEYNWEKEIVDREKTNWEQFNNEAQAEFLESLWEEGDMLDQNGVTVEIGHGAFYRANGASTFGVFHLNFRNHTEIANTALQTIRKSWL